MVFFFFNRCWIVCCDIFSLVVILGRVVLFLDRFVVILFVRWEIGDFICLNFFSFWNVDCKMI